MFGYVRPAVDRLSKEDQEAYKSAYCGLCHTMGRRHGVLARFTLNYDFTLLALLRYSCANSGDTACRRCPAHPFRKARVCLCGEQMDAAADESMILLWYKLSDDIADHGFVTGLPARVLRFLLKRGYKRAAAALPGFDRQVSERMSRLRALEEERSPRMDLVADTFAGILSAAAEGCSEDDATRRALAQLLYHLGRWIYLADAWDDLKDDAKHGRYNPLSARFSGRAEEEKAYIETTMTHSVRLIHSAFCLLEFGPRQSLLENILYTGIPTVQSAVLSGEWRKMKSQRRKTDERPL